MHIRHPMMALTLLALGAWGALGLFGKFVSPESVLARIMFLTLLFLALTATATPIARLAGVRLVRSKGYHLHGLRHALRQGALVALAVVANLTLVALGAWFWADVVLIMLAVILAEMIALARK